MFVKGHINPYFVRIFYYCKNIGWMFWIPIIVFVVLIPGLNYTQYIQSGIDEDLYLNIIRYGQWLMPFFSVWNVIFILRESVEAQGYELFYMTRHQLKVIDILGVLGISIAFITPLFIVYGFMFPNMLFEYTRILCICFLFLGLIYGVTYLFESITPTIMTLLLYVISNITTVNDDPVFLLFYNLEMMSCQLFLRHYLILILFGCLLFGGGYHASKKYSC